MNTASAIPTDEKGRPLYMVIDIDRLVIEDFASGGYQRSGPSPKWTETRSGSNFKTELVRCLEVADLSHEGRPNTYAVLDGQGRVNLLKEEGITSNMCHIHYDTSMKQRAKLFLGLDDMRKLKYGDTFKAQIARGEKTSIAIDSLLRSGGFNIRSNSAGRVSGLATIRHAYNFVEGAEHKNGDADSIGRAVRLFGRAWLDGGVLKGRTLPGQFVVGLSGVTDHLNGKLDEGAALRVLGKHGPVEFTRLIREENGGLKVRTDQVPNAFMNLFARKYNKASKTSKVDFKVLNEFTDGKNF